MSTKWFGEVFDVMLMHHLIEPDGAHDLGYIASRHTQMVAWKHTMSDDLAWYNGCDVDATIQIFNDIKPWIERLGLMDLYKYCQVPLAKICRQLNLTGIKVDPNRIKAKRTEFMKDMADAEALLPEQLRPYEKAIRVREKAPVGTVGKSGKPIKYIHVPGTEHVVPWESPKQVEKYLYETLRLPKQLHAKTKKLTTDKTAIDRLVKKKEVSPEAKAILLTLKKVRQLGELIGTFLKDGDEDKQVAVGRIHSNFLVHGTNTGRLASSGPNLQNIPGRARYIYVPSHSDWCFVEADFSSLENRLAAWYANDTDRLARLAIPDFNEHRWLASQIYKVPESDIDKKSQEYKYAKNTNHGADGAMGPKKLSDTYDIPFKDARDLLLQWRTINHASAAWQERIGNEAARLGVLTNAFGRKRWFWSHSAYTEGIRFNPQSTGADILFRSMIAMCYEKIGWPIELATKAAPIVKPLPHPARLVLCVHDSVLIETPINLRDEVIECMKATMTQGWPELQGYAIPIAIKVGGPGDSWGELKENE